MSMDNAIKEDILRDYFEAFSNKDVDTLETMFSKDIQLTDSHGHWEGIEAVVEANKTIFRNCLRITAIVDDIVVEGNSACGIIDIEIMTQGSDPQNDFRENHQTLKVIDYFVFNDQLKIEKISAYKQ
jgi:ketosteroid isomerase-like protein